ncbi:MAG: hypothetical protein ACK4J0_00700 [Candidatus Anstonellaceae archaeon]
MKQKAAFFLIAFFLILFSTNFALPVGATVSAGTPVTLGTIPAGTASAWGGNITRVNLTINSSTLHWQGFYGTITASLRLASGSGSNISTLKTWNVNTLTGQVYVSQSSNVDFTVLNSTPTNLSTLDSVFSFLLNSNDAAVNTGTDNANPQFYIGQYVVNPNTRPMITTYDNSSSPVWKEVVLRHANTGSPEDFVFVGIINSSGVAYSGEPAHFQIIVPENAVDSVVTTYYFYGEVQ